MRRLCSALIWLAAIMTVGAQTNGDLVHTVDAGETLISIASAYGVSLERLLELNQLDPEAILPIGRRLIVIPEGATGDDEDLAAEDLEAEAAERAISRISVAGLPPAPIAAAAAPMMDPADISPRLCFAVFADANQNGLREPGEDYLGNAEILLLDEAGAEALQYLTDGQSEPHCLRDLSPKSYVINAAAPAGFGLTSAASLRLDLRAGSEAVVEFGAKQGFEAETNPPLGPVAPDETQSGIDEPSILREISGIFVLTLAGLVFFSGMVVSIFLRGR